MQGFTVEFGHCWQQLPNKGLFVGLLLGWLVLFRFLGSSTFGYIDTPSLFGWMYNAYMAPLNDDGHGLLIPFVVLALFWWKRKALLSHPLSSWWPGLSLLALALALHILGYVAQQARLSIVALFVGIYGLMGLAWGPQWLRVSFFPYFLFAFCLPLGSFTEPVSFPLRLLVTKIVAGISQGLLGLEVVRNGTKLSNPTGNYEYEVAAACSGIRSLIATVAIALIYGFTCFPKWWKRLLLIASAVPLAVIGNVFRNLLPLIMRS